MKRYRKYPPNTGMTTFIIIALLFGALVLWKIT